MSRYCEKCRKIFEEYRCPNCGNISLREAGENDLCFLTEQECGHAGLIGETLRRRGIPFEMKSTAGLTPDLCTFFVYYDQLADAVGAVDSLVFAPGETDVPEKRFIEDLTDVEPIELPDVYRLGEKTREELAGYKEKIVRAMRDCRERVNEMRDLLDEIDCYMED